MPKDHVERWFERSWKYDCFCDCPKTPEQSNIKIVDEPPDACPYLLEQTINATPWKKFWTKVVYFVCKPYDHLDISGYG
jgi:hypothetical protein